MSVLDDARRAGAELGRKSGPVTDTRTLERVAAILRAHANERPVEQTSRS
jgi:hypothetical protein